MNNIKIFENDLPSDVDLSNEKVIALDNEALGLVLGRDPLTLVQLGLESKKFYLIKTLKAKSAKIQNKEWILEKVYIFNDDGSKNYFENYKFDLKQFNLNRFSNFFNCLFSLFISSSERFSPLSLRSSSEVDDLSISLFS